MTVKEEIRSQIIGALAGATFPIYTPEELLNTLPAGVDGATRRSLRRRLRKQEIARTRISRSRVPSKRQTPSLSGQGCDVQF